MGCASCTGGSVPFAKLHGLGNDFIVIDDREEQLELSDVQVARLCDRHRGIGADGLMLVRLPVTSGAAAYMRFHNADGSLAQMCGNGIRCFAKFMVDRGIARPRSDGWMTIDTLSGPRALKVQLGTDGRMVGATVDMGAPVLELAQVPVDAGAARSAGDAGGEGPAGERGSVVELDSPWGVFRFCCVSMGNPHAVCLVDSWDGLPRELFVHGATPGLDALNLDAVGAFFERHAAFPEHVNVEFACVEGEGAIRMRVFERGCGETLACGTGACAVLVAAVLTGRSGPEAAIELPGGTLQVSWRRNGRVAMTGPAEQSFIGSVLLPQV